MRRAFDHSHARYSPALSESYVERRSPPLTVLPRQRQRQSVLHALLIIGLAGGVVIGFSLALGRVLP